MIAQRIVNASQLLWQLVALVCSGHLLVVIGALPWIVRREDESLLGTATCCLASLLTTDHVRRCHPVLLDTISDIHDRVRASGAANVLFRLLPAYVDLCFMVAGVIVGVSLTAIPVVAAVGLPYAVSSEEFKWLAAMASPALALLLHFVIWTNSLGLKKSPSDNTLRGTRLTKFDASRPSAPQGAPLPLPWGGLSLAVDNNLAHFALLGNTRSGKSTHVRLLMGSVLPQIPKRCGDAGRAVVYDPKTDFVPIIVGTGVPADSLRILHPFDERCWAWDIAADTQSPTDATSIAGVFVQTAPHADDFFPDAARDVLAAGILALHLLAPGRWRFRDLLLMFREHSRVEQILASSEHTRHVLKLYGGDSRTLANVTATLRKHLALFEPIAACWEHCGDKWLSLQQWLASNTVLVLGYDEAAEVPISVINRALLQRLSELLLSSAARPTSGRSWIFLDECREIGRIDKLHSLLVRGAGTGECSTVVLGFQSVQGMEEVYGEKVAGEILGQCPNLAVFRLGNDRHSAEWAANTIGKAERLERYRSETYGTNGSTTVSEQVHERYLFIPEQLQQLLPNSPAHGLQGVFVSAEHGVVNAAHAGITGDKLFQELLSPPAVDVPRFVPRPPQQHFLADWRSDDYQRLGIPLKQNSALEDIRRLSPAKNRKPPTEGSCS